MRILPKRELRGLTKRFGSLAVVDDVSLRVEHGKLVCLLGPSGCGKTTTLRLIAGFLKPIGGNIVFVFTDLSSAVPALKNTVILGTATATIGKVMALVIAYVTTRRAIPGSRLFSFLATAPVAVPGIVLGVGLFLSYTRPPFVLYGTLWIMLLAFLTNQQLQAAFLTVHPELEDASRILGATRLQSLRQVTAPLLRSGVIATWCFIFIGVMRELSAAVILFTSQTKVLSVLIFDLNESGDLAAIAVLGLAMLTISFAVILAVSRIPILGAGGEVGQ